MAAILTILLVTAYILLVGSCNMVLTVVSMAAIIIIIVMAYIFLVGF